MSALELKANYRVAGSLQTLYSGGRVGLLSDGTHTICACDETVNVVNLATGRCDAVLPSDTEQITAVVVSPDGASVVAASRSLQLRLWKWRVNEVVRTWKAHDAPVSTMDIDPTSTLLATGSGDSLVKVFDLDRGYATHSFRGSTGVISTAKFHPNAKKLLLFTSSDDAKIRVWSLEKKTCIKVLDGHASPVRSFDFSLDFQLLLSTGRDKIVNVWNVADLSLSKTIPIFECLESVVVLPSTLDLGGSIELAEGDYFATAGEESGLRVWSIDTGKCIYTAPAATAGKFKALVQAVSSRTSDVLLTADAEQGLTIYDSSSLKIRKHIVGYNEEVIDLKILGSGDEKRVLMAANSDDVRIVELSTFNTQLLSGHTGIVLCLDASADGRMLVTSSKDSTVRVWLSVIDEEGVNRFVCAGTGVGHAEAVGCVAIAPKASSFAVSGSLDRTFKLWDLSDVAKAQEIEDAVSLRAYHTAKAHDKDINSVAISPNDKFFATGSQDKTAKIWRSDTGALLGVCRGHKRGIWCTVFSPVDQVLATSSGDKTIRLWALSDFSCLKTFEGHANSVLKVLFVSKGMQLLSAGGDGLIKLWTIRTNECVATMDAHTEKIWALAAAEDGAVVVSGGADALMNVWHDVTQVEKQERAAESEKRVLLEQDLSNLLVQRKYVRAIKLAIELDQPFRLLSIFNTLLDNGEHGFVEMTAALKGLTDDELGSVLRFVRDWNTNARHARVAQSVLTIVLRDVGSAKLMKCKDAKQIIEALLPYTERHYQRAVRLVEQSFLIDYTWNTLRGSVTGAADAEVHVAPTAEHSVLTKHRAVAATAPAVALNQVDTAIGEKDESYVNEGDEDEEANVEVPVQVSSATKRKESESEHESEQEKASTVTAVISTPKSSKKMKKTKKTNGSSASAEIEEHNTRSHDKVNGATPTATAKKMAQSDEAIPEKTPKKKKQAAAAASPTKTPKKPSTDEHNTRSHGAVVESDEHNTRSHGKLLETTPAKTPKSTKRGGAAAVEETPKSSKKAKTEGANEKSLEEKEPKKGISPAGIKTRSGKRV